jgi:N5-(carboxyethyl)ornithine synthase
LRVIGTSKKQDKQRYPIHPHHLSRIPENIRRQLVFEAGYGAPFNIPDAEIAALSGGVATRHELFADLGRVIICKPVLADLEELREGGTQRY